jgi:hypothetical protein
MPKAPWEVGVVSRASIFGLAVVLTTINAWPKPGGSYILTGKETGVEEIVKTDMAKYPDLYHGETLAGYTAKFKSVNRIGKRKLSAGDELHFPDTLASITSNPSTPPAATPTAEDEKGRHATVSCREKLGRFQNDSMSCLNADEAFTNIPEEYENAMVPLLAKWSPDPLEFEVTAPGIVTLVTDKKHKSLFKKEGWSAVGEAGRMSEGGEVRRIFLYEKYLDVGTYSYMKVDPEEAFGIRVLVF